VSDPREQRFQALAMMAVGAIVVGLCGLCTYRVSTGGGGYGLEYIVGGIPSWRAPLSS
jgi:hypothetical protein